jgi:hypothetical protein
MAIQFNHIGVTPATPEQTAIAKKIIKTNDDIANEVISHDEHVNNPVPTEKLGIYQENMLHIHKKIGDNIEYQRPDDVVKENVDYARLEVDKETKETKESHIVTKGYNGSTLDYNVKQEEKFDGLMGAVMGKAKTMAYYTLEMDEKSVTPYEIDGKKEKIQFAVDRDSGKIFNFKHEGEDKKLGTIKSFMKEHPLLSSAMTAVLLTSIVGPIPAIISGIAVGRYANSLNKPQ